MVEGRRAQGGPHSGDVGEVLVCQGHAVERAEGHPGRTQPVGMVGGPQGVVVGHGEEGTEVGVEGVDAPEEVLGDLAGADGAARQRVPEGECGEFVEFAHGFPIKGGRFRVPPRHGPGKKRQGQL
ncbi:hypothetical protein MN0502_00730 [Arthrobacter sp. MN05-02]|nr:hypothetical protein MN0502_00730 [Arthrobacter sp. MN05-02]